MVKENLEILSDKTERGKERPWREHKAANEYLAIAYDEVNARKAAGLCYDVDFLCDRTGEKTVEKRKFLPCTSLSDVCMA